MKSAKSNPDGIWVAEYKSQFETYLLFSVSSVKPGAIGAFKIRLDSDVDCSRRPTFSSITPNPIQSTSSPLQIRLVQPAKRKNKANSTTPSTAHPTVN